MRFSVRIGVILTLNLVLGIILSRLFMYKPLVFALSVVFSSSIYATPNDDWKVNQRGAICRLPLPQDAAPSAAIKSGEPSLPQDVTRIVADKGAGQINQHHRAEGGVIMERNGETLNANWVDYDQPADRVTAGNNFTLTRENGETVTGTQLVYHLDKKSGQAQNPEFVAERNGKRLQGVASSMNMTDENHQQLHDVYFNTCAAGDRSWYVQASKLKTNRDTGIGVAQNAKLYFAGIPILYTPWVDFPINGQRKSGFLFPTLSTGSNGATIKLPYYFNLAPNYDLTLTPGFMADRGATLGGEFRYLQPKYYGSIVGEYLPHDADSEYDNRYIVHAQHQQKITSTLSAGIDFNQASDDDYFRDFTGRNEIAENVNLSRSAWLNYSPKVFDETLNAQLLVQKYQALRDSNGLKSEPYAIFPRLSVNWAKTVGNADINLFGQFTHFQSQSDNQQNAERTVFYPSIKWDFHNTWGYVRPKMGVHATRYWLDNSKDGGLHERTASRILPIINVDSGINLERQTRLFNLAGDKTFIQTLEPRLFYNYIPTKSQNDLPNFDTTQNNFSYDQLFRENIYSGNDRINASNSVSVGLQTRLLDGERGEEYFRAGVGQKYYFIYDKVLLDGSLDTTPRKKSDFVGFFGGRIAKNWWTDAQWHWSESTSKTKRFDAGIRYNPEAGKVLSIRYKYGRSEEIYTGFYDKLKHIDLAAQWPINQNWYAVGRWNYSLKPHVPLEQTIGLEYKNPCGCWSSSFVAQRYVSSLNKHSTAIFFTLQLKDISTLGNDPYEALRLGIPGYHKTNNVNQY